MNVLVDTTVWSLALRRRRGDLAAGEKRLVREWGRLVEGGEALLVGPVRQEILSGIRQDSDFEAVRRELSAFSYVPILPHDYDQAAAFFNTCRAKGVTGTAVDLLICAVASRLKVPIFTTDTDFKGYAKHLPIRLHKPRKQNR